MANIITNPKVGIEMSALEARARAGDIVAQELLEKQALQAASIASSKDRSLIQFARTKERKNVKN